MDVYQASDNGTRSHCSLVDALWDMAMCQPVHSYISYDGHVDISSDPVTHGTEQPGTQSNVATNPKSKILQYLNGNMVMDMEMTNDCDHPNAISQVQQPQLQRTHAPEVVSNRKTYASTKNHALKQQHILCSVVHVLVLFCCVVSVPMATANNFTQVDVGQHVFDQGMAVGFDAANETILILGGADNNRRLLTFKDFVVEQQADLSISGSVFGLGQGYTQLSDMLWMIENAGNSLIRFNTVTREIDELSITIPIGVSATACLASMQSANGDEYLFVVGGWNNNLDNHDTLQIYDISSGQWMSSPTPPTLQTARSSFACISHEDILYAIGGSPYLTSIETLFIGNDLADIVSDSAQWSYFEGGALSVDVQGARAVTYGALILIAGAYAGGDVYPTVIHILDTQSKSIAVDADNSLIYGTAFPAAIVADRVWFIFGGSRGASRITSKYQYMILDPTMAPTMSPTASPTMAPTKDPTSSPTGAPTPITNAHTAIYLNNHAIIHRAVHTPLILMQNRL